jgi:hypothetical protein
MTLRFALILLLSVFPASAQRDATPDAGPSVTFNFAWSQGIPWQAYSITVQSDGKARFQGQPGSEGPNSDTDPFQQDFSMSEANRAKIFETAKKLNYFQGDFDSHLKKIAQTGTKTLAYESAATHGSTTYNWSQNADVQELTRLFIAIANTIDCGRKLAFQYRFDKLGMDTRLKELADLRANHQAEELSAIAPILHKIADDPNMMHISRQTAQQLLRSLDNPAPAGEMATQP